MTNNSKLFYCQLIRVMRPFQTIIQINIRWTNVNFCRIEGLEMNFELRFHVLKKICRIYHLWVIIIKRKNINEKRTVLYRCCETFLIIFWNSCKLEHWIVKFNINIIGIIFDSTSVLHQFQHTHYRISMS